MASDHEKLKRLDHTTVAHRQRNGFPSQKTAWPRWQRKGKERSTVALACTWVVEHQIGITLSILSTLFAVHFALPQCRHHTSKFFLISYHNPATNAYALGWDDIFFVLFWIILLTFLRVTIMTYMFTPLARSLGIKKRKAITRFAEQAWVLLYPLTIWSVGMYILSNSDFWLSLRGLWTNWPIREMDGLSKWYYLVQFAFWLHMIVVVNIEERRKDYWQMFSHHIVTCILIFASYGYHQSRVGTLILCLMDAVDILLPFAKILKYLHYNTACDAAFGAFIVVWLLTRHILYAAVMYSIYFHIPQEIKYGCYIGSDTSLKGPSPIPDGWAHLIQPFRDPEGLVCWSEGLTSFFLTLLAALQVILLIWFGMIVKVAYRVVSGKGADDVRSDDEEGEEEDEDEELTHDDKTQQLPRHVDQVPSKSDEDAYLEEEVLSTDAAFGGRTRKSRSSERKSSSGSNTARRKVGDGNSSGVNILAGGSSDRKELLGRIGCEKGSASDETGFK